MHTTILIDEKKHAEQAAQESEQRYKRLLAAVTDYVYSVAVERGRPATTSHGLGCEAVTGYTPREFEADSFLWYRMIYNEDRPAVTAQAEQVLRGETPSPLEHRIVHKDGRIRWIRNTPVPQKDDQGRLISYDGLISDITERKQAEAVLQRSTEEIHDLYNNAPCGYHSLDKDGVFLRINDTELKWLGYSREEVIGKMGFSDLLTPEGLEVFHTNFPQLKQRGWVSNLEFELVRKDGTTLAVILSATAVKDASGNYVMNRATIFDITERKRADLELQRSYQTQEVLNALLSISLQDISLEETLLQVIDQVLAIPWLSLEAKGAIFVVEADPITLVLKAQRNLPASFQAQCGLVPFGRCLCGRAAASGKIEFAEHIDDRHETRYEGMTPHGHYCVPIVSAGKVLGVMNLYLKENHRQESKEVEFLNAVANVVGGIIQRKRAEETRARLVAILEQTSDFVAIANAPDCHILYMNPAGRKMIGVGQEENLTPLVISDTHPEWANQMFRDEIIPTAIRDGLWRGDCAFRHRDGQEIPVLMVVLAHKSPAGDVVHFSTISRDISERKLAEEQLLKAHAELTQNEAHLRKTLQELQASHEALKETELQLIQAAKLEAVGTLAAGVAHEVKNPLQTMLLGLDYLANNLRGLNDTTTTVLGDMRDAVTRANVIVRELLQLSAAKDFEPREEDLNALVERSLWLINHEIIALQINVVRKLGTDLPRVLLDRSKMEQVFLNLFHNALQAMSQGGVLTVTTRHRRFGEDLKLSGPGFAQFQPGELVVIAEVQDTGKGIPEDHLPKIFGPFFTTKPTGVGTGLGLSVVKKIMDLHGGAIDVRNAPRGGVVVTLMLRTEPEKTL